MPKKLFNYYKDLSAGQLSRININLNNPFFSKKIASLMSHFSPKYIRDYHKCLNSRYTNHNALWSFARSGNHWVRFIVEYLTNSPTHGCRDNPKDVPIYLNTFPNEEHPLADVNPQNPFVLYKSHHAYATASVSALILLIRNYHDHLSNLGNYAIFYGEEHFFLDDITIYLELIAAYDRFNGNKMFIYYEDLLTYPEREISRIRYFLNGSHERYKIFMDNHDYYAEISNKGENRDWLYNHGHFKSMRAYQEKLTKENIKARKDIFQAMLSTKRYQGIKP